MKHLLIVVYPWYEVYDEQSDEMYIIKHYVYDNKLDALNAGSNKMGAFCKLFPIENTDEIPCLLDKIKVEVNEPNFDPYNGEWF